MLEVLHWLLLIGSASLIVVGVNLYSVGSDANALICILIGFFLFGVEVWGDIIGEWR